MNEFQKARLQLTVWYILISLFLLLIFSIAAIGAEQRSFGRIAQALGNKQERPHLTQLLDVSISNFESDFRRRLFLFDAILLLAASGASYFLSGVTLSPIQKMVQQQEEFSADASHELRTPLTTISIEIEALKRTEKQIPQAYQRVFSSIQEEVIRMRDIVDGLLTLVRDGTTAQKEAWTVFDVNTVISEVFVQMEPLAKEKNIQFSSSLQNDKTLTMYGNKDQLRQVVIILADNALKYTPEGKSVGIKTHRHGNTITITIEDTGKGILKEDLAHVFERFYRGKSTHKTKGSGLGLSIAKRLVESQDGKISVVSTEASGSQFSLKLPYHS